MKELTFKKVELEKVSQIFLSFKLKGKPSRLRMRLVRLLQEGLAEYEKERTLLLDEYALKDTEGNFIKIKREVDGVLYDAHDFEDESAFIKELNTLMAEKFSIDHEKYKEELSVILEAFDNFDEVLSGSEAINHDLIYEQINEVLN